jgi:hypothetical protein
MIPPRYFKVYGERRSGTSYLTLLLQRNFTFDYLGPHWTSPLGWKHGVPDATILAGDPRSAETAFFFLTRNPYNWVWSMKRYAPHMLHKCALPLPQFFADPWDERGRISEDGVAIEGSSYANLLDLRYRKFAAADVIAAQPMHRILRYEDMVSDWSGFLRRCETEFGLKRRLRELHDATDRADATRDAEFADDRRADIDARNTKAAVVEFFGRDNLAALNRLIDWEVEARFGYERIKYG